MREILDFDIARIYSIIKKKVLCGENNMESL